VSADLFISYAWTSPTHREWVRLLVANLKTIGFDVLIDADVDYGDSLTGFMRRLTDCRHVLLIVDENYVERADNSPNTGVGQETAWIAAAYQDKPSSWLSVIFKDNQGRRLPKWLSDDNPKGISFNSVPERGDFPGSEQIEDLWRWIEDLPANRDHAVSAATLRQRARGLELIDHQRDPNSWSNPAPEDDVVFEYDKCPNSTYRLGCGQFQFALMVSSRSIQEIYVCKDPIHAVGVNRTNATTPADLTAQLTPGRIVTPGVGDEVILQNEHGALCLVDIRAIQVEQTSPEYVSASIRFHYRILLDS